MFTMTLGQGHDSRSVIFAKSESHFIRQSIRRILAALDYAFHGNHKLNSIRLVLTANVLALVRIQARDVD